MATFHGGSKPLTLLFYGETGGSTLTTLTTYVDPWLRESAKAEAHADFGS